MPPLTIGPQILVRHLFDRERLLQLGVGDAGFFLEISQLIFKSLLLIFQKHLRVLLFDF